MWECVTIDDKTLFVHLLVSSIFVYFIPFSFVLFYSKSIASSATPFLCLLQPVLAVGRQLGITSVSLISSCSHSIKKFRQTAMDMDMLVGRVLHITKHSKVIGDIVKKFLEESVSRI
jgi:hypothetical protein